MVHSFLFEWKKRWKNKRLVLIFLSAILSSVGLYILHYTVASSVEQANLTKIETDIIQYGNYLQELQLQHEDAIKFSDEEVQDSIHDSIELFEQNLKGTKAELTNKQNGNWQSIYENEITMLTNVLTNGDELGFMIAELELSRFSYRTTLNELVWMEEHNLEPFIQQTRHFRLLPNVYENFEGTAEHQWKNLTTRYSKNGLSYLYLISQSFLLPMLLAFGCVLFGQVFSRKHKNEGFDLSATLPITTMKLYTGKLVAGVTGVVLFTLSMILAPLIFSLLLADLGSLHYPVLMYELNDLGHGIFDPKRDPYHFISLRDYFEQYLTLAAALTLFLFSLYSLFAIMIRHIGLRIIVFLAIILTAHLASFGPYNPFSYFDLYQIVNGQLALDSYDGRFQVSTGVGVLLLSSILFFALSFVGFKWRAKPGYS
ncbi:hypothetical protein [Alkalicoccobacillus porphyridii]|uniref:ABC transporter permease n=1 Tax=Alkalicoccobacillus porphyridii TaxID=2597270 RepID=A0A553ZVR0_9BACI|nr:hypothetical protein [Alkalicoccobacillus porphyridii]TSB45547.1 hypothetical protein FN960_15365 [Alkalicoccobacillus porphyridii]